MCQLIDASDCFSMSHALTMETIILSDMFRPSDRIRFTTVHYGVFIYILLFPFSCASFAAPVLDVKYCLQSDKSCS